MELPLRPANAGAAQFAPINVFAFPLSIMGGLAGFGSGLIDPIFLGPAIKVLAGQPDLDSYLRIPVNVTAHSGLS